MAKAQQRKEPAAAPVRLPDSVGKTYQGAGSANRFALTSKDFVFEDTSTGNVCNQERLKKGRCATQLVFAKGKPFIRLCSKFGHPGKLVAVTDARDAQEKATRYCPTQPRATKKSSAAPAGLAGADWALVRGRGMDDDVVSTHRTKEAAVKAMRKAGGDPDSLFTRGMRVVHVGPGGADEAIEIFGKRTIRPRSGGLRGVKPRRTTKSAKDERQYKHILAACLRRGKKSKVVCTRIAAATVNKQRCKEGRAKSCR